MSAIVILTQSTQGMSATPENPNNQIPNGWDYSFIGGLNLAMNEDESSKCINEHLSMNQMLSKGSMKQNKIPTSFGIKLRKTKPDLETYGNFIIKYHLTKIDENHTYASIQAVNTPPANLFAREFLSIAKCSEATGSQNSENPPFELGEGSKEEIKIPKGEFFACMLNKIYNFNLYAGKNYIKAVVPVYGMGGPFTTFTYIIFNENEKLYLSSEFGQDIIHGKRMVKSQETVTQQVEKFSCKSL
ncbi:hypothetical protein [Novosphingobium rosa]|uniref:hypothetical protein n=1 Tax=Novosphingobium rosa TaxID=76978 RepID=UPI000A9C1D36|nr:hypothetical protein [Novosphingobium rosa]